MLGWLWVYLEGLFYLDNGCGKTLAIWAAPCTSWGQGWYKCKIQAKEKQASK